MVSRLRINALAVLVGVFLLGAATGVGVTLTYSQHKLAELAGPDGSRRGQRRLDALTHVLELTPDQREAVGAILKREEPEVRARMRDAMEQCGQSLRDHKAKVDAEIRAVLTPEQQKKFDQLAAEQAEKFFFRHPRGPHPPASQPY
jgi:Spy/CpxP family protein refolding chaperone